VKFAVVNFSEIASDKHLRLDAKYWIKKKEERMKIAAAELNGLFKAYQLPPIETFSAEVSMPVKTEKPAPKKVVKVKTAVKPAEIVEAKREPFAQRVKNVFSKINTISGVNKETEKAIRKFFGEK